MTPTRILLGLGCLLPALALSTSIKAEPFVCDDPAYVVQTGSDLYKLQQIFNATESSRRLFSEIHYYAKDPNLTMGMGHWTYGNLSKLFARLRADRDVWDQVAVEWVQVLGDQQWQQIETESRQQGRDTNALTAAIDKLFCTQQQTPTCIQKVLKPWSTRVGQRFNSDAHWLHAGWHRVSRLPTVAKIQLGLWAETILEGGIEEARARGIATRGGISTVISAKSSGIGKRMFGVGQSSVHATGGKVTRTWSLLSVPGDERPTAGSVREMALIQDWKALVAWQYYTVKEQKVRSRMSEIWRVFYEGSWGSLPKPYQVTTATTLPRRHTGCYMSQEAFKFAVQMAEKPDDCNKVLPKPSKEPCVQ